tara:strand:- start:4048 stop:4266 length:219 start_codon:yes stop_codon:yes gene_type:complete
MVVYCGIIQHQTNNKMTHFQTKPHIFRSEVIGWIHIFDCDIEIQTDLSNEIIDYSGCGFKKATQLILSIKSK